MTGAYKELGYGVVDTLRTLLTQVPITLVSGKITPLSWLAQSVSGVSYVDVHSLPLIDGNGRFAFLGFG